MPYFNTQPVNDQTMLGNKDMDMEPNGGVCPDAPTLTNAVPAPVNPSSFVPSSIYEVQDPAAGLTANDLAHPHPGITGVTVMTPTKVTVQIPLLTLLNPPSTTALQRSLLAAHLRAHPVLLLPSADGHMHLAANYPSAGHLALDTALSGPATPFTTTPLHPADLQHLRRFTLLVPTHKGWKGDDINKREQLVEFLFSDGVVGPAGASAENDPLAVEHRWFRQQAREQAAERGEWIGAVRRCVRTLMAALSKALLADGEVGEEARESLKGQVVFQQWFDGWGDKCGADCVLVREVEAVLEQSERFHGRQLWGKVGISWDTDEGAWAEVEEEVVPEAEDDEELWDEEMAEMGEMEVAAEIAELES